MTQTNVDTLVRALALLQVLEELTLNVIFYCKHECDVNCDDKCDHNCYGARCHEYRHDEQKQHVDLTKEKVLEMREEKLKFFKEFTLNEECLLKNKILVQYRKTNSLQQ